jgi:hypothetical protein
MCRMVRAGLVTIVLCAMVGWSSGEEGKRYGGLTIRQWSDRLGQLDPRDPRAAEVVPALIAIISDEQLSSETRRPFAVTLGRIGAPARDAVPVLVTQIRERDRITEPTYLWAARALGFMGVTAKEAAPALIDLVFDEDVPLAYRTLPIEALARIGTAHPDVLPALIRLLQYQSRAGGPVSAAEASVLRELAAEALALLGPDAELAVPLLVRAVRNPRESESVRRRAMTTLGSLGPRAVPAVAALLEVLQLNDSATLRNVAGESLGEIGPPALPVLVTSLRHPDPDVRQAAAAGIARMGNQAQAAVEDLLAVLGDDDDQVRIQICETLESIGGATDRFAPELIRLLTSESRQIRMRAMRLLVALGPRADPYRDQLRALERHASSDVRAIARITLRRLEEQ